MTPEEGSAREWWRNTADVLRSPGKVFEALRDDPQSAGLRAEPVLAIVLAAGIAAVLQTPVAGRLMDSPDYDGLLVAVWAFIAGGMYGTLAYWLFGASLWAGMRALGSEQPYRLARHMLAYASVPVALSLALWPVKVALFGADLFTTGGSDSGAGGTVFTVLFLALVAWTLVLLAIAVRTVQEWSWAWSAACLATSAAIPTAVVILLSLA